ncbi:helix-turn-helix transcriptional regulator [Sporosarcina sp. ANT_H38]|uniref:helix-turn-helix transcriptional regulator n=1 Tax=Sporosarcina sp. ANT_H38 TaxID=2597358 RepID=UPI0011F338EC|nr:helix-turn-helix transcriptional regulator [Sporosarcina sp. ANT_H38]KAA0965216.1 helix-turn-helix transcriptional regulator [Sporosarcina sp. ANT_H38]
MHFPTNRVKGLRARFNLTQGNIAEKVGGTRQTIGSLEKGSYTPSLLLALNIAGVFEMPIERIFSEEEMKK